MNLSEGWSHVARGGRVVKATSTPPANPNPSPQPVTEALQQAILTATMKTARPEKPEPKPRAAHKTRAGKSKKKAAAGVKTTAAQPTTP